ncbi:MAG: S53 family peptidase [Thermoplasmata archaeon]
MKIVSIIAVLILISIIPFNSGSGENIFVGHISGNSLILIYYGDKNLLENYFLKYNVSVSSIRNYYYLYGNFKNIKNAFHLKSNSAYLPENIASYVQAIYSGNNVNSNLNYASDPYMVKSIIDAYHVNYYFSKGINGSNYTAVIVVPYGDKNINQNLENFDKLNGISSTNVSVDYFISKPYGSNSNWTTETDLDVEILHAFAPGAKIILAVAPNDNSTSLEFTLLKVIDENLGNVISLSWGGPENEIYNPFFHYIFKKAAESRITVISASGDSPIVEYPASDPYVISVGGTTLSINGTNYIMESLWRPSGGGFSSIFKRPPWQICPGKYSQNGRGVPDISLDSNPQTGVYIYSYREMAVGGTSMAAPMFAGMVLDLEQKENESFGFFTPELYYMNNVSRNFYFNDIFLKNSLIQGWYPQIGLGSPKILNWSFSQNTFSADVSLGSYSNVSKISFYLRGCSVKPFHTDEIDAFFVKISSNNESLSIGINQSKGEFFYNLFNDYLLNISVRNNFLYEITLYFSYKGIYLNIDNYNFSIGHFSKNVSINVIAKSTGRFSFYTNLGPVEFRNFEIVNNLNEKFIPERIISVNSSEPDAYGAMEIPFLRNDFLIGAIGVQGEKILWPRAFNYVQTKGINGNFIFNIPNLIGTGTVNDPYILSGLEINSSNIGFYYQGKSYFVLNHCIINAPLGILVIDGNLKIIDSVINSTVGIECLFAKISVINTKFYGLESLITPFSMATTFGNIYLVAYTDIFLMLMPEGIELFLISMIISVIVSIILIKKPRKV